MGESFQAEGGKPDWRPWWALQALWHDSAVIWAQRRVALVVTVPSAALASDVRRVLRAQFSRLCSVGPGEADRMVSFMSCCRS